MVMIIVCEHRAKNPVWRLVELAGRILAILLILSSILHQPSCCVHSTSPASAIKKNFKHNQSDICIFRKQAKIFIFDLYQNNNIKVLTITVNLTVLIF